MDAIALLLLFVGIIVSVLCLFSPFWLPFVGFAIAFWEMGKTDEQRMKEKEKNIRPSTDVGIPKPCVS